MVPCLYNRARTIESFSFQMKYFCFACESDRTLTQTLASYIEFFIPRIKLSDFNSPIQNSGTSHISQTLSWSKETRSWHFSGLIPALCFCSMWPVPGCTMDFFVRWKFLELSDVFYVKSFLICSKVRSEIQYL